MNWTLFILCVIATFGLTIFIIHRINRRQGQLLRDRHQPLIRKNGGEIALRAKLIQLMPFFTIKIQGFYLFLGNVDVHGRLVPKGIKIPVSYFTLCQHQVPEILQKAKAGDRILVRLALHDKGFRIMDIRPDFNKKK